MDLLIYKKKVVAFDSSHECLFLLEGGEDLAEESLVKQGFLQYHESGGYTVSDHSDWKPLCVPQEAFSRGWEGQRFFLKGGQGLTERLYRGNPMLQDFKLPSEAVTRVTAQVEDQNARISRAEYRHTQWGSADGEKEDLYEDPVTGATFVVPHGEGPSLLNLEDMLEIERRRYWNAKLLRETIEQNTVQWFADWID